MAKVINVSAGTSSAQIQKIVDAAAEGTIIRLAAGDYTFTSTVKITTDGITIEGAGVGQTVITLDSSMEGEPAFQVGDDLFNETSLGKDLSVSKGSEGSTSITLSTASHGLEVGDVIWIERPNDDALFEEIGDTEWQKDTPLRTQMVTVTKVDGKTISFDDTLDFDFSTASTVQKVDTVKDVALSGMTLQGDYGTSDPTDFSNTIAAEDAGKMILVNTSEGFTLTDIAMVEPGSNGLVVAKSINAEVDGLSVTGAHNKGDGGNGYSVWIRDVYDSSFSDITAIDTRHAVLFASYTSASGNSVHISYTNRDVNFHGGLDSDNTVIVDQSIRDTEAERDSLGWTVFINEDGTSYGPPTDPDANTVLFTDVQGSNKGDEIVLSDGGATAQMFKGNDIVTGGAGSDSIDMGAGSDVVYASAGKDMIDGGSGADVFILEASLSDVAVSRDGSSVVIETAKGTSTLTNVEYLELSSGRYSLSDDLSWLIANGGYAASGASKPSGSETASSSTEETASGGTSVEDTSSDKDDESDTSLSDGTQLTSGDDKFSGTSAADTVHGLAGSDTLTGNNGNDVLYGDAGNDTIYGNGGADALYGGDGDDKLNSGRDSASLTGGAGADKFVMTSGQTVIQDFDLAEGDTFIFNSKKSQTVLDAASEWAASGHETSGLTFAYDTQGDLVITATSTDGLSVELAGFGRDELL